MTKPGGKKAAGDPPSTSLKPAPVAEAVDLRSLAEGILARTIRPRVTDIRRLAEAVLAGRKKDKKKAAKKAERKLSKIPGQKGRK